MFNTYRLEFISRTLGISFWEFHFYLFETAISWYVNRSNWLEKINVSDSISVRSVLFYYVLFFSVYNFFFLSRMCLFWFLFALCIYLSGRFFCTRLIKMFSGCLRLPQRAIQMLLKRNCHSLFYFTLCGKYVRMYGFVFFCIFLYKCLCRSVCILGGFIAALLHFSCTHDCLYYIDNGKTNKTPYRLIQWILICTMD